MISFKAPDYHNPDKHYTQVKAVFDEQGNILPLSMEYEGEEFAVDRVCDIRPAASLKSGGAGIRYTCMVDGRLTYLFLEDTRWFFEVA